MAKPTAFFPNTALPNFQEQSGVLDYDPLGIVGSITQKTDVALTSGYASSGGIAITVTGAFATWAAYGVVENLTTLEQMVYTRANNNTLDIVSGARARNGTAAAAGNVGNNIRFIESRFLGRTAAQIIAELTAHDEFLRSGIGINLVGNSGLEHFQRGGISGAVNMSNAIYNAPDRFWSLVAGTAPTIQQQAAPTGFTAPNVARIVSGGTSHRAALCQALEGRDVKRFRGWPATGSVRIRASKNSGAGSINVRFAVLEWTGTTDAPTKSLVNNWASSIYTPGNFFVASNYNVLGGGVVAVAHNTVERLTVDLTIGASCNNLVLVTWLQDAPAHAADYIEVSEFRLSPGRIAPPSWQPRSLDELSHCQRYCWRFVMPSVAARYFMNTMVNTTSRMYGILEAPVPMRTASPVFEYSSAGHFFTFDTTATGTGNTLAAFPGDHKRMLIEVNTTSAVHTVGRAGYVGLNVAGAYIGMSDEL